MNSTKTLVCGPNNSLPRICLHVSYLHHYMNVDLTLILTQLTDLIVLYTGFLWMIFPARRIWHCGPFQLIFLLFCQPSWQFKNVETIITVFGRNMESWHWDWYWDLKVNPEVMYRWSLSIPITFVSTFLSLLACFLRNLET